VNECSSRVPYRFQSTVFSSGGDAGGGAGGGGGGAGAGADSGAGGDAGAGADAWLSWKTAAVATKMKEEKRAVTLMMMNDCAGRTTIARGPPSSMSPTHVTENR